MNKLKKLFNSPKKIAAAAIGVLILTGAGGAMAAGADKNPAVPEQNTTGNVSAQNAVTLEEAKNIVLKDCGLEGKAVQFTKVKLDREDGTKVYEITFYFESTEYDYEVRESDGVILAKNKEQVGSDTTSNNARGKITMEQAKEIALKHIGVTEKQVAYTKTKTDYDDGILYYEIEFIYQNTEHEFEIRANDGKITDYSAEKTKNSTDKKKDIGAEPAKKIALKHAGVSEKQVSALRVKREYDDGTACYEIEFIYNGAEYEYQIKASDGTVLEFDIDRD